jgi:hypothetical protein
VRRREFIAGLDVAAWSSAARAQQPGMQVVVDLKTALGLTIPEALLATADEVIQ